MPHIPVLLQEVLESLNIQPNGVYLDATFGAGGYSKPVIEKGGFVCCCDQDLSTKKYFDDLIGKFPEKAKFYHSNFAEVDKLLKLDGINSLDGVMMDLGVSSMQLDQGERGFSLNKEGFLDMRMNQNSEKTATDFVNCASLDEIADVIYYYGDEREAYKIARAIVKEREKNKIETTTQLTNIVNSAIPYKKLKKSSHNNYQINQATKTFQAIRIFINEEIKNLIIGLQKLAKMLKINGRIIAVTFHSIEDKIVKQFFQSLAKKEINPSYQFLNKEFYQEFNFKIIGNAVTPNDDEIQKNIRSRSAKMRVLERI